MMTMLSNAMFYTGGTELALRKIRQNTDHKKTVFWRILRSVEFMLSSIKLLTVISKLMKNTRRRCLYAFTSLCFSIK